MSAKSTESFSARPPTTPRDPETSLRHVQDDHDHPDRHNKANNYTHRMQQEQQQPHHTQIAFSKLQLPNMNHSSTLTTPSLRFLVVADFDLKSASALAEYALRHEDELGPAGKIDCILACGPMASDNDLCDHYYQGRSAEAARRRMRQRANTSSCSRTVHRSREETAALEGLASSALSQLESIVCRVVYLPNARSDPSTTLVVPTTSESTCSTHHDSQVRHMRLTPNSINVHAQWLPLAPGLGVVGYAGTQDQHHQPYHKRPQSEHYEDGHQAMQHDGLEFVKTLKDLINLAPPPNHPDSVDEGNAASSVNTNEVIFASPVCQTIVLTQIDEAGGPAATVIGEEDYIEHDDDDKTDADAAFEWPQTHLEFLTQRETLQQVVLNVAATPRSCPPFVSPSNNGDIGSISNQKLAFNRDNDNNNGTNDSSKIISQRRLGPALIAPGSLSRHGDFVLVDIGLHPSDDDAETCQDHHQRYRWRVDSVQHRTMFKHKRVD